MSRGRAPIGSSPRYLRANVRLTTQPESSRHLNRKHVNLALPLLQYGGMGTILLVILILMLLGAVPAWPHSRSWGYAPSGGLGLVVIILLILVLTGRL
jgi:hypothetical protein